MLLTSCLVLPTWLQRVAPYHIKSTFWKRIHHKFNRTTRGIAVDSYNFLVFQNGQTKYILVLEVNSLLVLKLFPGCCIKFRGVVFYLILFSLLQVFPVKRNLGPSFALILYHSKRSLTVTEPQTIKIRVVMLLFALVFSPLLQIVSVQ
jgi:hypothetical protein